MAGGSDACDVMPNPSALDSNAASQLLVGNRNANGTAAAQLVPKPQTGEPVLPPPTPFMDLKHVSFVPNEAKALPESQRWIELEEQ